MRVMKKNPVPVKNTVDLYLTNRESSNISPRRMKSSRLGWAIYDPPLKDRHNKEVDDAYGLRRWESVRRKDIYTPIRAS